MENNTRNSHPASQTACGETTPEKALAPPPQRLVISRRSLLPLRPLFHFCCHFTTFYRNFQATMHCQVLRTQQTQSPQRPTGQSMCSSGAIGPTFTALVFHSSPWWFLLAFSAVGLAAPERFGYSAHPRPFAGGTPAPARTRGPTPPKFVYVAVGFL